MPTYTYKCASCEQVWEKIYSMSNNKQPESEPCPFCEASDSVTQIILSAPAMGDPVRLGITRPDGGIKEALQRVNEKTARSKLKDLSSLTKL